jgi:CheY-like chemotaxis protein
LSQGTAIEHAVARDTVLVVDDERVVRTTICMMLHEMGYKTLEAGDGEEALQLVAANSESLAATTLNLMMPTMNGRATLAALSRVAPFLPIVISSGLAPFAEPLQGRIPGTPGTTYLQKPYEQAQLKAALDRVIGELRGRRA